MARIPVTAWDAVRCMHVAKAEELARAGIDGSSLEEQADAFLALSFADALRSDFPRALDRLQEAGYITAELGGIWLARVNYVRAIIHRELGEFGLAVEAFEKAMAMAFRTGHSDESCGYSLAFGYTLYLMGCSTEAIEMWEASLPTVEADGLLPERAHLHAMIAMYHLEYGLLELAEWHYHEAVRAFGDIGDDAFRTYNSAGLGAVASKRGDHNQALPLFEAAVNMAQERRHSRAESVWQLKLGEILLKVGRIDEAIVALSRCADLSLKYGGLDRVKHSHRLLAEYFDGIGDQQNALHHYRDYARVDLDGQQNKASHRAAALRAVREAHQVHLRQQGHLG